MPLRSVLREFTRLLHLGAGTFLVVLALPPAVRAQTHPPGTDYWTHIGGPPRLDLADFGSYPIPASFFDPGSDPFTGVVPLLGSITGPGNADTSVRRLASANLPPPFPATDTVPIELVQLSLVSSNPITVTYGGGNPELWNVKFCNPPPAPPGGMTVTKSNANGGTFSSTLPVQALFTFTRVNDGAVRNLPVGGTLQIQGPWSETPVPNGVGTGPNLFPGDSTLDLVETTSGSAVLQTGIAAAVKPAKVPALSSASALALAAVLALAGVTLLRGRSRAA